LLTAYIKALAAQRPLPPGGWQHFKGGTAELVGFGRWDAHSSLTTEDYLSTEKILFRLEENIEHEVRLNRYQNGALDYTSISSIGGWGDRVFYICKGKGWARKPDNFLGLVGSEHPEHEGLLRFIQAQ
jgi:hypothetical protein